jgi:hypothetical protein
MDGVWRKGLQWVEPLDVVGVSGGIPVCQGEVRHLG